MIDVRDIRRSFGEIEAVRGVSFHIDKGTTFGLLGPNGAGKSTTINIVVGLLRPDAGEVSIGGASSSGRARKTIGVTPQSISLYPEFTGEENLRFFARLYAYRGRALKQRVEWALDFAGLADRASDRVAHYSGGMQRRLNLAAALVHEPDILLLDEPTVGVDPQSRNHLFDCIERLKGEGLTIIYTTHYMEEAQRLCDRVAIMDEGRILDVDSVEALITRHGGASVLEIELADGAGVTDDLPGTRDGNSLRIETDDPVSQINALHDRRVAIRSLKLHSPDLETVFLSLTGRRLRDD